VKMFLKRTPPDFGFKPPPFFFNFQYDRKIELGILHLSIRDGQVMTFPSHKSHQVFFDSIESSQVKSFYVLNSSLSSQVIFRPSSSQVESSHKSMT